MEHPDDTLELAATVPPALASTSALDAMKAAMLQAEEAAAARALAKKRREPPAAADHEMLAELALIDEPVELDEQANVSYALGESSELEALIAEAAAVVPDRSNDMRDGDLVVMSHETPAATWYEEAAEAALPTALRGMVGPVDVKTLLQALMIEIGDVKRTNAMLLDLVARVEEKVDRVNRQMKDRRIP